MNSGPTFYELGNYVVFCSRLHRQEDVCMPQRRRQPYICPILVNVIHLRREFLQFWQKSSLGPKDELRRLQGTKAKISEKNTFLVIIGASILPFGVNTI